MKERGWYGVVGCAQVLPVAAWRSRSNNKLAHVRSDPRNVKQ